MESSKKQKFIYIIGISADIITIGYLAKDLFNNSIKITMSSLFGNYFFVMSLFITFSLIGVYTYNYLKYLHDALKDHLLRIKLLNAIIKNSPSINKDIPVVELKKVFTDEELYYLGIDIYKENKIGI